MADAIRVQPGPGNYFCHPGALAHLPEFFTREELRRSFWVHGEKAGRALAPFLQIPVHRSALFSGHCTAQAVSALTRRAPGRTSLVIGVGGGSALDTAKALAIRLAVPFVAIPTVAATCAAWTPLSVWYDQEGRALGYEVFKRAGHLTLVEPRIILEAPRDYLLAWVADTLVKWYEARELAAGVEDLPLAARLGLEASLTTRDVLFSQTAEALRSQKEGQLTQAFIQTVDAIIAGGGLVGGLGERFTRVAGAHAIHNGLTALEATHRVLHGLKVAYGLLIQLKISGDGDELGRLKALYRAWGLPLSLADLGMDGRDLSSLKAVAEKTLAPQESIHLMKKKVSVDQLVHLMAEWEEEVAHA